MYVGNSVQGIREAGLQLYSVADGCFGSWGNAELCPCMAALQPTARQLWACTLQSDAVFVCLSELPKWSGRPWSTRLLTARWYSPSTGWRPCWSARDFWWVFLIGSLLSHCIWSVCKTHRVDMMMFSGSMRVIRGSWATYPLAWTAVGTCLLFHLISQIPVLRRAESCSGGARRKISTRRKVL